MPRKAPEPSVQLCLNRQKIREEKKLCEHMLAAHRLAVHSFLSSLHLSAADREMMKKLLR